MHFKLVQQRSLPLEPQTEWLWYSNQSSSFIIGDERAAFAVPISNPSTFAALPSAHATQESHPCNLPIPISLYDEFIQDLWHGFKFLERSAYDHAIDSAGHLIGDLLRTLVFGPDYQHYLLHPPSGLILSLRSGKIELLQRTGETFKLLDQTKTRGRAALAFAAHPTESTIAYGDNFGTFHAHKFDQTKFGKATKIAAKDRKASRLEFVNAGKTLVIGGMGYLASYSYIAGKFAPLHDSSISVRDFTWLEGGNLILVNQGMHGISAFSYGPAGFTKLAEIKPGGAVQQIAVSKCQKYLAASFQESPDLFIYSIQK